MAFCKFCRKEITWTKEGRRNVPVEGDGGVHKCEEMKRSIGSFREITKNSLSAEEIKRIEDSINQKKK